MKTQRSNHSGREGAILGVVLVMLLVLTTLVLSLYKLAFHASREVEFELKNTQAFWLAEAGRQDCIADLYRGSSGNKGVIAETDLGPGTYKVEMDGASDSVRIATGTVTVGDHTVTRSIRIELAFVSPLFEKVVYAGNRYNPGADWDFKLRGSGTMPVPTTQSGHYPEGSDIFLGDIQIDGNLWMYDESQVGIPDPNRFGVAGDVETSGTINQMSGGSTSIAGTTSPGASVDEPPDMSKMNYDSICDYDVAAIFNEAGVSSGRLPSNHPLYNVLNVTKNPSDRSGENASTPGDDFYFEPGSIGSQGSPSTAVTPLNLGTNKIYYVDGNVWFHSKRSFGFKVNGQATIVSTRDVHISDNVAYADRGPSGDMLALVALGQYTGDTYSSAGNIYFGDPTYGTLYTFDAFMFANHNFYYNTSATSGGTEEPNSGFKIFGNFMAVNQVVINRDWYTINTYRSGGETRTAVKIGRNWYDELTGTRLSSRTRVSSENRAATYDPNTDKWFDLLNPMLELTTAQVDGLKHYAMQVGYDDRIRDVATQMRGLPRGNGAIFAGIVGWQEIE